MQRVVMVETSADRQLLAHPIETVDQLDHLLRFLGLPEMVYVGLNTALLFGVYGDPLKARVMVDPQSIRPRRDPAAAPTNSVDPGSL